MQNLLFDQALSSDSDSIDDDALRSVDAFSSDSEDEYGEDEPVSELGTHDLDMFKDKDGSPMNLDFRTMTADSRYFSVRMESVYGGGLATSNRQTLKDQCKSYGSVMKSIGNVKSLQKSVVSKKSVR